MRYLSLTFSSNQIIKTIGLIFRRNQAFFLAQTQSEIELWNSISSCVFFFLFCFWNTLERFSILFTYSSYYLVLILTNTHQGHLYICINSKIPRKIREKCIFYQCADLDFKQISFDIYHGATPWSHCAKKTLKKLNLLGKTAVDISAWIKAW